jgi:hypothetical protein
MGATALDYMEGRTWWKAETCSSVPDSRQLMPFTWAELMFIKMDLVRISFSFFRRKKRESKI